MTNGYFQNPKHTSLRKKLRNNATDPEQILWAHLRKKQLGGYKFIRQYGIGRYIVDFYCPAKRLVVELDGGQQAEEEIENYDAERTTYIQSFNIRVIRFWNSEVMNQIDAVCDEILVELESS